jgi:NADPH:quinone reductase-like Zn-dependent oxidoreductase
MTDNNMKAAVRTKYGPPEILTIKELGIPSPKGREVLIRVHATTVNRTDCAILWGKPFLMRFFTGLFKPALAITGTDFAGQIESVGKNVSYFKPGDKVIGFRGLGLSTHAQYVAIPETEAIVNIPENISYKEAAACLEGPFYALDAVRMVKPEAGQKSLVYGATGAIGSAMVQFLKFYGLYVTAVCGGENRELLQSLGADKVIDYKTEDFTQDTERYDFIFDAVGKSSFASCKPLLKKKGTYVSTEPNFLHVLYTPLLGGKKVKFRPPRNIKAALLIIKDLIERGSFKPVIDREYPFDRIAEAFNYVVSGQKIGNVVITLGDQEYETESGSKA